MADEPNREAEATVAFFIEAGHLKRTRRTGWWIAGIRDPESVAKHSFRTAVIAFVLARMEGGSPDRAASIALFHDISEARTGDVSSIGKPFVTVQADDEANYVQTLGMSNEVAGAILARLTDLTEAATVEARCAKDADKLECLLQACEYEAQGNRLVQPWSTRCSPRSAPSPGSD